MPFRRLRAALQSAKTEITMRTRQLETISRNAPGVFYQAKIEPNGQLTFPYVSPKSMEIVGVAAEDAMRDSSKLLNAVHPEDAASLHQSIANAIQSRSPWRWEGRLAQSDDSVRWIRGAAEPTTQDDGSIIWDGILTDVTEQKLAENTIRLQTAQLANASRLAALGEMAGGVAHEINTPLSVILVCAERIETLAKGDDHASSEIRELATDIFTTVRNIASIVTALKSLSRDGSHEPFELVDVSNIIDRTLVLCAQRLRQNHVHLIVETIPIEAVILCRPVEICQVLLNLVNNAFDAVCGQKDAWVKIQVSLPPEEVAIRVSNSGPPIPNAIRDKLFLPFFTTKGPGKGTGLGLSISRRILDAHNGDILLEDNAENTTFVVRFHQGVIISEDVG